MRARLRSHMFLCYIALLVVFAIISLDITWLSSLVEMNKITLKEERVETVIIDDLGIISSDEFDSVRNQGTRFKLYNIGLWITESASAKDAENMAKELLPEKNAIMIAISIRDNNVSHVTAYCDIQGNWSEENLGYIIRKFWIKYGIDKEWLTTTFNEVVSYYKEVENDYIERYNTALYIIEMVRFSWVAGSLFLLYYMYKELENMPDLLRA